MTHPNVAFVKRFYELFGRGEVRTASSMFADDFLFVPAGKKCQLAAPRRGASEMLKFTELQSALTGGTWIPCPYDVLASDNHAVVLVTVTASRNGHRHEFRLAHVWRIESGRATELHSYVDDQYAYDEFFA
jgi:ketosteroid isomerase-like protein